MLIDANLLVYAISRTAPQHEAAEAWLEGVLSGDTRVGLPWESLLAVARITTNPRIFSPPVAPDAVWSVIDSWLQVPIVWIPQPTEQHAEVLGRLITSYRLSGDQIPDAHLAAIAIEHGLEICSADTDFARFTEVRWVNPIAA
jgi:toxin-antitoxin system PIN domain toxin